jgi:hypothetical protein
MRTLIAIAAATLIGISAAGAAEPAQVAAKDSTAAITRTEPLTSREAREIARNYLKDSKVRQGRVGDVSQKNGDYKIVLKSGDGIPFKTLTIDAMTGEIKG